MATASSVPGPVQLSAISYQSSSRAENHVQARVFHPTLDTYKPFHSPGTSQLHPTGSRTDHLPPLISPPGLPPDLLPAAVISMQVKSGDRQSRLHDAILLCLEGAASVSESRERPIGRN
ncbi:hypothetical protein O1611_g5772 [Lasiodiplodia mahajangana]|uniref:Uncharacterized protein n=1 Tax=Lasiodiplodia mahajangana TaxID=1108764 RepID=A0ACC2JK28_9PEZI|nr:hypothetical protein O1611_g5772 [Lasiodiplodia mahajangana]